MALKRELLLGQSLLHPALSLLLFKPLLICLTPLLRLSLKDASLASGDNLLIDLLLIEALEGFRLALHLLEKISPARILHLESICFGVGFNRLLSRRLSGLVFNVNLKPHQVDGFEAL